MTSGTGHIIVKNTFRTRPASRATSRLAGRLVASAASVIALALVGCHGGDPDPYQSTFGGYGSDTTVVSGTPRGDASAFKASSNRLSSARFDKIDRNGPDSTLLADATSGELGEPSSRDVIGADGQPSTTTIAPATQPAPTTRPLAMPSTRVELPGERVRFIWDVQGFGSGKVSSAVQGNSRRTVTVAPGDINPLVQIVQAQLADQGTVVPLLSEGKLVVVCNKAAEQDTLTLLRDVDKPAQQVEITAKIFEVTSDFDYQQGMNILAQRIAEDGTQTALSTFNTAKLLEAAAGGSPFQGSVISIMQTLQELGISVDASFELLAETGLIHVVSEPRLTVAEGQTGYMLAGQELPIQSAQVTNNTLTARTDYKPVGVQLYVTPQVVAGAHVQLHAVSVVSSVAGFTPLPTMSTSQSTPTPLLLNPILESREAETQVTVATGETLVISGMRMVRTTTREDKVPGLGDLPVLGHLFKSHRSQRRMTDLYFFLTPTLVDDHTIAMVE